MVYTEHQTYRNQCGVCGVTIAIYNPKTTRLYKKRRWASKHRCKECKEKEMNVPENQAFCSSCQQWLPHLFSHSCYDRADLRGDDGERVKCLIFARVSTGAKYRPYHVAWAGGMEMTAEYALCGVGPVDLTVDRAQYPLPIEYHLVGVCKNCTREWLKGP